MLFGMEDIAALCETRLRPNEGHARRASMPLKALPADPEPTDEELGPYLIKSRIIPPAEIGWPGVTRRFAALQWRVDKRREDPNLFLIPFATTLENYPAYLQSEKWQAIRTRVLDASGRRCICCDRTATQVHHRDYRPRVLDGDDIDALVAICARCHERIEAVKKKHSWNEAERLLASLVLQCEKRRAQPPQRCIGMRPEGQ